MSDRAEAAPGLDAQATIHVSGEWREAFSGATREILDPADGQAFALVA